MIVNGQEGRRFWGVWTVTFDGKPTDEPFLGELHGPRNRAIAMTDTDGYYTGEVKGNVMSFCYSQAGVQQTAVVSCTDVHRAR